MVEILGFAIILVFLVLGEVVSALIGHFMPGSVIGMILLFIALCTRLVRPEWIRRPAEFLTKNMTVLFIPSAIGIIDQWGLVKVNIIPWLAILFICWAMVLASSGWTHQIVSRLVSKRRHQ